MKKLLHSPVAPGLLLIIVSLLAIALANSALAENYQHFVHASLFGLPVEKVVNDVLMSVFSCWLASKLSVNCSQGNYRVGASACCLEPLHWEECLYLQPSLFF